MRALSSEGGKEVSSEGGKEVSGLERYVAANKRHFGTISAHKSRPHITRPHITRPHITRFLAHETRHMRQAFKILGT